MAQAPATPTLSSLVSGAGCLDCLSKKEKLALRVYLAAQQLKADGGADLTDVGVLMAAVACFKCLPDFRLDSLATKVALDGAVDAGWTGETDIASLRSYIACLRCADIKALKAADLYLTALLEKKLEAPLIL